MGHDFVPQPLAAVPKESGTCLAFDKPEVSDLSPTEKKTIWVVDDEAGMRTLLGDFLAPQDYEVLSFSSAEMALKALGAEVGPAVILSDVRMDPMDGVSFLTAVQKSHPGIPVLLYTGAGSPQEKAQALAAGAAAYLSMPFTLTQLKTAVEQILAPRYPQTA